MRNSLHKFSITFEIKSVNVHCTYLLRGISWKLRLSLLLCRLDVVYHQYHVSRGSVK